MKALQITGYGKLSENLRLAEVDEPEVLDREVLIEIHTASVNPIDYKIVKGDLKKVEKLSFPSPIGFDASGVVKKIGKDVSKFKIGDEVFVRATRKTIGTFAEFIALDERLVAHKPKNFNHAEAASIPLVGLTTFQAFHEKANAKSGQKVLIHAGSGGIGTYAIQYAKAIGLHVTTTTSAKNAEFVKNLGADEVICYDQANYLDQGEVFDIVYDTLGGDYTLDAFKVLKNGGTVVSIAGVPDKEFAEKANLGLPLRIGIWLMNRKVYRAAGKKNAQYFRFLTESSGDQLSKIAELIEAGKIRAVIDREFDLSEAIAALEYLEKGRAKGKVIIKVKR